MKIFTLSLAAFLFAGSAMAQPKIASGGVKNAASYAPQGLPSAGIAEGSIFSIFGDNLGPDTPEFGFNYPLPTVTPVGKVSVTATVAGTTVPCIILYSGKTQINAVLPSNTPVGTGTLTVTYNGQTSATVPIEVVKNSFGIFSVNSAGSGPGIVTFADYSLVTPSKSANPGETLIVWGTGLGPVTGNEAGGALPGDQPSVPAELYVGGQQVTTTYKGRSGCCAGLDQIAFVVPSNVEGCSVPVAIKIADKVSNFATVSIARSGRACTDTATGLTTTDLGKLFGKSNIAVGSVTLSRTTSITPAIAGIVPASTTTTDTGFAGFERFTFAPGTEFSPAVFNSVSFGACVVTTFSGQNTNPFPGFSYVGLDAGPNISVAGPAGSRTLTPTPSIGAGFYSNSNMGNGTPGSYLDPGAYTITGPGGSAVGPFTAKFNLPQSLVWTNQASITTVNRAAGQTVTWTGGDPTGFVSIDGSSFNLIANNPVGATFHCQARVADGSFNIPAIVLLSLPAGTGSSVGGVTIPTGSLSVGSATADTTFTASGLDLGIVSASASTSKTVTYQ